MLADTAQPTRSTLPFPRRPTPAAWRVMKLGGTTVADAGAVLAACERVKRLAKRPGPDGRKCDGRKRVAVVVSALAGVTDCLDRLVRDARDLDPEDVTRFLQALTHRHVDHLNALSARTDGKDTATDNARLSVVRFAIEDEIRSLGGLLRLLRHSSGNELRELALSMGERLSARMVHGILAGVGAELVDPSSLLVAQDALPDLEASRRWVRGRLATCRAPIWVVPGFFARDSQHRLRLLGRGGSDTSATLLGAALGADRVEIWTDVDGVYDADPRGNPAARRFPALDYDEAERLAEAGARVLHARSMAPVRAAGVPVVVRDSFRPDLPGTWIGPILRGIREGVAA